MVLEAEASFYAGYNHCNVEYLQQAGVGVTFIKLAELEQAPDGQWALPMGSTLE